MNNDGYLRHVWWEHVPQRVLHVLAHNEECEGTNSTTTSVVTVVPSVNGGGMWRKQLSGMRLLQEYPHALPSIARWQKRDRPA